MASSRLLELDDATRHVAGIAVGAVILSSFGVTLKALWNSINNPVARWPGANLATVAGIITIVAPLWGMIYAIDNVHPAIASLLAAVPLLYVAHSLYIWFWNVHFHPLAKFPGPKLAGATHLWSSAWIIAGRRHKMLEYLHTNYGPVVRTGPNNISFIDEAAWKDIYNSRINGQQLQKGFNTRRANGTYSVLNAPDGIHSRQRRVLAHAFSEKALREQEELLQEYVTLMISKVREQVQSGKAVNMVQQLNFMTFDLIGELAFSAPFDALESQEYHPWMLTFARTVRGSTIAAQMLIVKSLLPLLVLFGGPLKKGGIDMFEYAKDRITQRIAHGSARRDFISKVLENLVTTNQEIDEKASESKASITRDEINATFNILIIAGSETTATALSGAVYLLCRHPDALERLQQEVRGAASSASDLTIAKVNSLEFLFAVLEETLRVYPPVPIALARRTPPEGATICGQFVPGDTIVGVPQLAANTSPRNFHRPKEFLPQRWLPDAEAEFAADRKGVVQPFSMGPRNCLGKNLAYAEMKLALANLVYAFDFELTANEGNVNWIDQKVFTLWDKTPLMVRLMEVSRLR